MTVPIHTDRVNDKTSATAQSALGSQGKAEGDVLERTLDALREIILGPGTGPTVAYAETLGGNTWHKQELRDPFQHNLKQLNDSISDLIDTPGSAPSITVLAGKSAGEIRFLAQDDGESGKAYRYALRELIPFALLDVGYELHNVDGKLDLYSAGTGVGATSKWIDARASFLEAYSRYRTANGELSPSQIGGYFEDQRLGVRIGSALGSYIYLIRS